MENVAEAVSVETPLNCRIPPLGQRINKDNARSLALKGWEARRERAAKLAAEAETGRNATPQCERIADEMNRLQGLIAETDDADTIVKLSGALERQFKMWQVLSGTPNPGARKAGRTAKPAMIQPEPIVSNGADQPNG